MIQGRALDAVAGVEGEQHADGRLVDRDAVDLLQDPVVAEPEVLSLQAGDGAASLGDERVNGHDVDAAAKSLSGRLSGGNRQRDEQRERRSRSSPDLGAQQIERRTEVRRRIGEVRPERLNHARAGPGEMPRDGGAGVCFAPLAHQDVRERQRR